MVAPMSVLAELALPQYPGEVLVRTLRPIQHTKLRSLRGTGIACMRKEWAAQGKSLQEPLAPFPVQKIMMLWYQKERTYERTQDAERMSL